MDRFPLQDCVEVLPFVRQVEGSETVVGRPQTGVFLVLPNEALELVDQLASGMTVGEVQDLYFSRHGETPDMQDLLSLLEVKGLVRPIHIANSLSPAEPRVEEATARFHFEFIPQWVAKIVFGRVTIASCLILIALAGGALLLEPRLLPGWNALYFTRHMTLLAFAVLGYYCAAIFVHEMAHLLAARALGISSRLGFSHRLWTLVAETDLSGLWSVSRRQRYIPLLAGPLVDATSAALLILALSAQFNHMLEIPAPAVTFMRAALLIYLLALLWQCFFFLRTDFYYVIANYFGCKNLMGDTESFLRNQMARLFPRVATTDQQHIPKREMKTIQVFAAFWLAGRGAAFWALCFIHVPLLIHYCRLLAARLNAGYRADSYGYVDSLIMASLMISPLVLGLGLWLRSLMRSWRRVGKIQPSSR